MLSSNQVIKVSGKLNQLKDCLKYALTMSDDFTYFTRKEQPTICVYQITPTGKYCIGWGFRGIPKGWEPFPFDFDIDIDIISDIIIQFLEKAPIVEDGGDGSYKKGFIMECIDEGAEINDIEEVQNAFYGIVSFAPYSCFYHK